MVKYKYIAYGKVTVTKDTDGLADSISFANNAVDSGGNFFLCVVRRSRRNSYCATTLQKINVKTIDLLKAKD